MSSSRRAWIVATSIGVVEALKDQGVCRWNKSTLRSVHQHAKSKLGSYTSQAKNKLSSSQMLLRDQKFMKSEESLRTVMYLSCWGPNN